MGYTVPKYTGGGYMNTLKRCWCRAFQGAFRLAIPLLPYRRPEQLADVTQLPARLAQRGCKSVLVVTSPSVSRMPGTRRLLDALTAAGAACTVYDKTVPNPTTDTVEEALALYRRGNCQAIIGIGGGSSLDCAKAVGVRAALPHRPLSKAAGVLKVRRPLPPLAAVPTTAGTGSETTIAAVITDARTRDKYAISDFPLIPDYAVLDPKMTLSLPPHLTASTGMDALTHAVEAFIGRSTTRDTREDALAAVGLIFANLERACRDGSDLEARRALLTASFRAGCAFTKSYVGYVHAAAHSLGGAYNVAHGYANAVILPVVLRSYGPAVYPQLARLAQAAGLAMPGMDRQTAALAFLDGLDRLKARCGIGNTIPELRREDIPALARHADREANPLYPVPVLMDAKELEGIFYRLL